MSEDYGNDFVTLTDEEGDEYEFEIVRELDVDGEHYAALLPVCTDENCDHEDEDVYIVRVIEEDGEEIFEIIEDDAEFERVSTAFEAAFAEDDESEDEE
ncbi:MAG TPA: DUF1292 domain-containing protein [Oscillospiraceae bacterium]|nr:DUF1292 domain-containing protein [Oscillospiraceae bacterium]HPK35622.1 DUF1292 domain-containing protein [Oscillospiraceae bacterium]HPR74686.1 DUF1292 domain-containing protein [Oscillospiraceae bacterium]